jgi:hypothetical protein
MLGIPVSNPVSPSKIFVSGSEENPTPAEKVNIQVGLGVLQYNVVDRVDNDNRFVSFFVKKARNENRFSQQIMLLS